MPSTLKKAALALVVTVVALLALNGLAFLGELAAYGTWYADGQPHGLYRNAPGERPQLAPGARLNGLLYRIHVNELGFRGPAPAEPRPADAFRVWCLGGSTTFDIYAPDDETTWPALLQDRLQQGLPDRTVEVLNAGVPGEILYGSTEDLVKLGRQVRPDVVVIYHGPNDLRQVLAGPQGPPADGPPPPPLLDRLNRLDPALLRVATRVLQRSSQVRVPLERRGVTLDDLRPIRERLLRLLRVARQQGATPLLATHALRAPQDATGDEARALVAETAVLLQMHPESAIAAFRTYNELVRRMAEAEGVPLADVRSAVGPERENWGDATHFRPAGSAKAAEAVARAVLERAASRPRVDAPRPAAP